MVEQFCKSILQLEIQRNKSLANLAMGLASQVNARSVVEIALSPCYHYQFSSINKAIDAIFNEQGQADVATGRLDAEKNFVHQKRAFAQALRQILATEHGQQSHIPSTFPNAASKEVCVPTQQSGKRQ